MPKDKDTHSRSSAPRKHTGDRDRDLADLGVDPISADDYFLKSDNFRLWLRKEKGKYFDELSGEKARHYFAKFVKAWNRGELSSSIYNPPSTPSRASENTSYKWGFASKLASKANKDALALEVARADVASATTSSLSASASASGSGSGSGAGGGGGQRRTAPIGPMLPPGLGPSTTTSSSSQNQTEADLQLEREDYQSRLALSRATRAPRDSSDTSDFAAGSKEKMLANKASRRAADNEYRASREGGGMEDVREDVLMGAGDSDSFAARVSARDAARARGRGRGRGGAGVGRGDGGDGGAGEERRSAMRDKERETMDMFKAMARQRFGD